ncbi:MAG: four helix bundle protein [Proteobacteria bacterium]|nr:four helix bundle protein [Pseudomonadota bacterium]
MRANNIENLDIYKRMHKIAIEIYKLTESFPKDELYGLISQMKRSAVSVNSNLMEGGHRNSIGEYKHFIGIARGSASELKYQIIMAKDLQYIAPDTADRLIDEINQLEKMMTKLSDNAEKNSNDYRLTTND